MTNNQIIRNEAARLDPATLHAIATAHHTPDEIAAIAAACKTTDENGNEQPATVADFEIMLAADELHTFDHWKKEGKSVKKGEKHLVCCYLWKYTTKPSKEQREKQRQRVRKRPPIRITTPRNRTCSAAYRLKAASPPRLAGLDRPPQLLSITRSWQPNGKRPKPQRKPPKRQRPKPPPRSSSKNTTSCRNWCTSIRCPRKKAAAKKKPAGPNMKELKNAFVKNYSRLYQTDDDHESGEFCDAVDKFDELSANDPQFAATVQKFNKYMGDLISSDREAAAFVMALDDLEKAKIPEMVPSVQQLCFA